MIAYADDAGVPLPGVLVPFASLLLLVGGVLLAFGLAPVLGLVAIATFLLGVTPEMHDFWNESGEARHEEADAFAKNVSFLAAAVAFWIAVRTRERAVD